MSNEKLESFASGPIAFCPKCGYMPNGPTDRDAHERWAHPRDPESRYFKPNTKGKLVSYWHRHNGGRCLGHVVSIVDSKTLRVRRSGLGDIVRVRLLQELDGNGTTKAHFMRAVYRGQHEVPVLQWLEQYGRDKEDEDAKNVHDDEEEETEDDGNAESST